MTDRTPLSPTVPSRAGAMFPTLTPEQVSRIAAHGRRRSVREGEVLIEVGDRLVPFFVVTRGRLEILQRSGETEILVERAIALKPRRVLDPGTGSGAIAAALAAHLPDAEITATDASEAAIGIARQNLPSRVVIRKGPDFEPVKGKMFGYKLESTADFRFYGEDTQLNVKSWNTKLGYETIYPFLAVGQATFLRKNAGT